MSRVEFETQTSLPPDRVIAMLTDFSDRRPDVWPGLWGPAYEVFSVGDQTAEVREGNKTPKIWARERYDWSRSGTVRWEVIESNFCKPGSLWKSKWLRRQREACCTSPGVELGRALLDGLRP